VQGGGTILLSAHGNIQRPGGQSVFTDGSQPTLVYHYYERQQQRRANAGN